MESISLISADTFKVVRQKELNNIYSKLELYLMGLASLDEVPFPLRFLSNSRFLTMNIFSGDSVVEMSKDQLLSLNGVRVPDVNAAQKNFSAAFVVMSERNLTNVELGYFNHLARLYPEYFSYATSSRGSMTTRLTSTTGIEEKNYSDLIRIGPNPTSGKLFVIYNFRRSENVCKQIYSIERSLLYERNNGIRNGNQTEEIDLSGYRPGIYILRITNEWGTNEFKIIKN